ncbi:hypothetical protein KIH74_20265 [Kineosporia sp. J2-2]|uniref:Uncharacterized protein n=1 Tax=Kineosporia corallincola TaxID=2835133 RepID=A0ABS5TMJ7_9ACTN|nr:DUF6049 family protein [Kineosporia corallincola]MBT0771283.1 hypothetical protein [Kineosporia corallincola]
MRYLASRALGAWVFTVAVTLCVVGPAAAPAQAAGSRPGSLSGGVTSSGTTPTDVTADQAGSAGSAQAASTGTATSGSAGASSSSSTVTAGSKKLQLTLSTVSPTSLTAQDALVVSGTARNPSTRAMKNVTVALRFGYTALTDRDAVLDWVQDGDVSTTATTLAQKSLGSVGAGETVSFSFKVAAGGTGLSSYGSSFGPRPFSLVASSAQGQLAALRSTLVWAPQENDGKLGLTLLAPLTSTTPSTTAGLATEESAAELLPASRLSRIVTASSDPAIGWAIDPALLAAAKALEESGISEQDDPETTDDESAAATPASSASPSQTPDGELEPDQEITAETATAAGRDWLERISAGLAKRTVLGLPYADADLNSLLKGGKSPSLLRQSDKLGEAIEKETLGKSLYSRISWPADGQVSGEAVQGLASTGHRSVILSADQQQPQSQLSYTPSGRSTVKSKDSTLTGLLYDEDLSSLFADAGTDNSAQTTQTMLAVLAAISAETTPDDSTRQVLAVAPRDWDPQPADVQRLTTALRDASSWVSLSSLKNLGNATAVDREDHQYGKKAAAGELPKGNLSNALAMDRDLDNIAPGLINNQDVVRRLEQRIASVLSYAWRSDLDGQANARRSVMDDVGDLTSGVQLLIGTESKVFTARSAPIQVTVDNQTDYDVRVSVSFTSGSGQLKVDRQPDPVTITAQHRQSFRVEATAVATGDVIVTTKLLTGEGAGQRVLGDPQTFEVKVRPNWESWGLIGMAVLLVLLLLFGLLRSFRRNRTRPRVPLHTIPDVDDDAARAVRKAAKEAAAQETREAAQREAITSPIPRITPGVTDGASAGASGGATERSPEGSSSGDDVRRAPGIRSTSAEPGDPHGMQEQKSSSVPTMAASKGAQRRSPTRPKENR